MIFRELEIFVPSEFLWKNTQERNTVTVFICRRKCFVENLQKTHFCTLCTQTKSESHGEIFIRSHVLKSQDVLLSCGIIAETFNK